MVCFRVRLFIRMGCFVLSLCLASTGQAATFTSIGLPPPFIGPEPTLNLPDTAGDGSDGILDFLYGLSNLQRIDDDTDQFWTLSQPLGEATARSRFTRNTLNDDTGTGPVVGLSVE